MAYLRPFTPEEFIPQSKLTIMNSDENESQHNVGENAYIKHETPEGIVVSALMNLNGKESQSNYTEERHKEIRKIIRNREFELIFQRQFELITDDVDSNAWFPINPSISARDLESFIHPESLDITTSDVVEYAAARSSLMKIIDNFVIENVPREVAKLKLMGKLRKEDVVSINIEPVQIKEGFANKLLESIDAAGILPSEIEVELLERTQPTQFEEFKNELSKLYAAGIKIAIDDYGDGYNTWKFLDSIKEYVRVIKFGKERLESIMKYLCDDSLNRVSDYTNIPDDIRLFITAINMALKMPTRCEFIFEGISEKQINGIKSSPSNKGISKYDEGWGLFLLLREINNISSLVFNKNKQELEKNALFQKNEDTNNRLDHMLKVLNRIDIHLEEIKMSTKEEDLENNPLYVLISEEREDLMFQIAEIQQIPELRHNTPVIKIQSYAIEKPGDRIVIPSKDLESKRYINPARKKSTDDEHLDFRSLGI